MEDPMRPRSLTAAVLAPVLIAAAVFAALSTPARAPAITTVASTVTDHIGLLAWGSNTSGQLGDGTRTGRLTPVTVAGLTDGVVQVASSGTHTLALRSDSSILAWGQNSFGQLGNGTTTDSLVPVPVQTLGLTGVVQVAAGNSFSLALLSNGTVWAWGDNAQGQLGDNQTAPSSRYPVQVPTLTGIVQIAAMSDAALARQSDGTVWAWGANADGRGLRRISPVRVGITDATRIATSLTAAYVLTSTGHILLWGQATIEYCSVVGEPCDYTAYAVPYAYDITGVPSPTELAAGGSHLLIRSADGSVWGWGPQIPADAASFGGDPLPPFPGTHPPSRADSATPAVALATDGNTAFALRSDGTVLGWGLNDSGQLGDGTTTPEPTAVHLPALTGAHSIVAVAGTVYAVIAVPAPPPDFTFSGSPLSATVSAGGVASATVGVTATDPTSTVTLSTSGQPLNSTVGYSRTTITGSGLAGISFRTTPFTPVGTYPITISATGPVVGPNPAIVHSVQFILTVVNGSQPGCVAASYGLTAIPDNGTPVDRRVSITRCPQRRGLATIEVVATHAKRGDLVVEITGSDGVAHLVKNADPSDTTRNLDQFYTLPMSALGNAQVTFTVEVTDVYPGNTGTLTAIHIGI
jgi:alpha-tubulin suppressor-like RCC1 family protein